MLRLNIAFRSNKSITIHCAKKLFAKSFDNVIFEIPPSNIICCIINQISDTQTIIESQKAPSIIQINEINKIEKSISILRNNK